MSVTKVCHHLGFSRQTFYYLIQKKVKDEFSAKIMKQKVLNIRKDQARIGGRKLIYLLQEDFRKAGIRIGRDKFFKFLKDQYLLVKRKKNRTITTRSYKRFRQHPNLIKDLEIKRPEQVWVSDITYVNCKKGPLYLHLVTDAYSKKIMGYFLSDDLKTKSTLAALNMALKKRKYPKRKLIHHSDRGFQYASEMYTQKLNNEKIKISMTTKYDPYENAIAERVNGILKDEFEISNRKLSIGDAKRNVNHAIKIYNQKRPHWSCQFLTPNQAHKFGKFKLKKYSKFNFSKN